MYVWAMAGSSNPVAFLTIIRYPRQYVFFALLAMALHRLPLMFNRRLVFWKLLGCGRGGGFSKKPDWRQWSIFSVHSSAVVMDELTNENFMKVVYGNFIHRWIKLMKCETWTVALDPREGHGSWGGKEPFGKFQRTNALTGKIAVLTRATIRLRRLKNFWAHVDGLNEQMKHAQGLMMSVSIGEMPFVKQATFSIWESTEAMQRFAYGLKQHTEVIQKTRKEKWYSEEMFIRFEVVAEYSNKPVHPAG